MIAIWLAPQQVRMCSTRSLNRSGGRSWNSSPATNAPVGDIVDALELAQPSVSKHLRVLRDVGLVRARRDGRQVMYRTNATELRPLHEWAGTFERLWRNQLTQIKERAERE